MSPPPRPSEIASIVSRHARHEGVQPTIIDALSIYRATSPSQPLPTLYEPALCIVVQGRKQTALADETYVYDSLNYLVISITLPMTGQIIEASTQRPYLCMSIDVDTRILGELMIQQKFQASAKQRGRGVYVARTTADIADAALRLARLLDAPSDAPVLAPLILR